MDPSLDLPKLATCTSCRFVEDKSNYWTAVMYFKHRNGSFIRVPQMANHNTGPGFQNGGMTVYYFQPIPNLKLTAFRPGFRMRVGNPNLRRNSLDPADIASRAVTLRCFEGLSLGTGAPGYAVEDTFDFPKTMCSGGIRSNIYFPQCWDGVNLDSPDHESHVSHPPGAFFGAQCPSTYPVHLPLLFMEIVWDTRPFNDPELWPKDGSQPFVFSMGDPTGFGQHADYVFGWEGDSLQRAMDVCTGGDGIPTNCPELTVQDMDTMNACTVHATVPEIVEGQYIERLPGCNPLQHGPSPATAIPPSECTDAPFTTAAPLPTTPLPLVTPPWTVCHSGPGSEYLVPDCDSIPPKTTQVPGGGAGPAMVTPVPGA
ncbi:hypothetical protein EST38_g2118 [Candolleomyces aberdarensis]|uniref:DUF1996 domain-containing protein n=1 Tax=Candolleomyces aberdarensis TaxID=2316362 RepID=A0A4Q2DVQ8_9AGAR|nr:hypothetical protein EST38_g2118 [Candolleomyces aberdarensis]